MSFCNTERLRTGFQTGAFQTCWNTVVITPEINTKLEELDPNHVESIDVFFSLNLSLSTLRTTQT